MFAPLLRSEPPEFLHGGDPNASSDCGSHEGLIIETVFHAGQPWQALQNCCRKELYDAHVRNLTTYTVSGDVELTICKCVHQFLVDFKDHESESPEVRKQWDTHVVVDDLHDWSLVRRAPNPVNVELWS